MDDTDDFIDEHEHAFELSAGEKLRLKHAFGDDVAQRFLRLRGIFDEGMQDAALERYAEKQALKAARAALALAAALQTPRPSVRAAFSPAVGCLPLASANEPAL